MKMNLKLAAVALVFGVLLAGATTNLQAQDTNASNYKIEGGWYFNVVVPPGTPGPPSFFALDTFAKGGGWSGHASTDSMAHWSGVFGSWAQHDGRIVITAYQFIEDNSGAPMGLVILHRQMHFTSANTVQGTSSVSFCDLDGQNCFTPPANATFTGVRIHAAGPVNP
jgi:hypothetical protein